MGEGLPGPKRSATGSKPTKGGPHRRQVGRPTRRASIKPYRTQLLTYNLFVSTHEPPVPTHKICLLCSFAQRLAHFKAATCAFFLREHAAFSCCGLQPLKPWMNYAQIVTELLVHHLKNSAIASALCQCLQLVQLCQTYHMTLSILSAPGGLMTNTVRPAQIPSFVALPR